MKKVSAREAVQDAITVLTTRRTVAAAKAAHKRLLDRLKGEDVRAARIGPGLWTATRKNKTHIVDMPEEISRKIAGLTAEIARLTAPYQVKRPDGSYCPELKLWLPQKKAGGEWFASGECTAEELASGERHNTNGVEFVRVQR